MKFSGSLLERDKEKAEYEIIGIPFDGNSFETGSSEGPEAIREASQRLESFLWHKKIELSDLYFYDRGDIGFRRYEDLFKIDEDLDLNLNWRKKKIFIGGDHSISFPIVKRFANANNKGVPNVIAIDAHADFRDTYKGGKFSNACVMRRIAELIGFENLILIGVRSSSEEEYEFLKDRDRNGIRVYDAAMLKNSGIEGILSEIEEKGRSEEKTYLSIDIDVLDPSIAPGVENPEPSGMDLEDLISLIGGIIERRNVVSCDLVEVNPRLDIANEITSLNAARIIFEILACYWERDHR